MIDFGKLLDQKIDDIVERWVDAVLRDGQIETVHELTHKAILDSMPKVLEAMATIVTQGEKGDLQKLVSTCLEHGVVRADQGFDASEIAREYRLLRSVIFSSLESDLIQGSPTEILRAVQLIDTVIDEAIARCFNSYTESRLHELEQLQGQLKLTNQELTRLLRSSQISLSELAHELKTPLTSIIGYSDLFLRQNRQDGSVKDSVPNLESIERVLSAGRQLLRLINDALEISRYEAGKMKLQEMTLDIQPLINSVVEMVEPLVSSKNLKIEVNCDRAPDLITTDPLRLQQIITNLLSNAIRYTEQGTIRLTCECISDTEWAITFSDSGIGIPLEDQKHLFEPYFKAHKNAAITDSTGLGLAIVSRLVKLLQGEIKLTSELGSGSTFTVKFPLHLSVSSD